MEQNLQVLPKKVWSFIRLVYSMLREGVSKKKILLDLNMMMKRAKIAGKALQNLMMFHHHHNWAAFVANSRPSPPADSSNHLSFTTATATPPGAYEFSCSNSPITTTTCAKVKPYHFSLFSSFHKKNSFHGDDNNNSNKEMVEGFSDVVLKAMEMVRSQTPSPALPGFGRSPAVRQLRITDSPFPLSGVDEDVDGHVDEAAEEFISRFYKDLMMQNSKASFSSSC